MSNTHGGGGPVGDPDLMHYRVKRGTDTIFLLVEPSDSFGKLKAKIATIMDKPMSELRLIAPDQKTVLEEEALVSDQMIEDDSILYLVYHKGKGFEEPFVAEANEEHSAS